ncbi:MAG: hypothetical protein KGR24_05020 [Planctomycetes bacterium]|nr:hypothetical protein [Planctomycetota bacterium]
MRTRRPPASEPSRRLHVGRLLGAIFGLAGLLCVPTVYFQLIDRDPRCRSVPMFLLMLLFFPCLGGLVGFLAGVLGSAVADLTQHDRTRHAP